MLAGGEPKISMGEGGVYPQGCGLGWSTTRDVGVRVCVAVFVIGIWQAPWIEGMVPAWFDRGVIESYEFKPVTSEVELRDHATLFWTPPAVRRVSHVGVHKCFCKLSSIATVAWHYCLAFAGEVVIVLTLVC